MSETLSKSAASNLFREPPHRFIEVGEGEVAYRRVGHGPDVLFVHGWPVHSATFRQLLPYLTPHVTCHLVDLVGAGQSRFDRYTNLSIDNHIRAVREVVDSLGLRDVALVGHDSGGLIARHALATDQRVRGLVLIDTEQPQGVTWRFRQFLIASRMPGFGAMLAWAANQPWLCRSRALLGDCFEDRRLLDGEFAEFFLRPLSENADLLWATVALVRSFELTLVDQLADIHSRVQVPVQLVWGAKDPFFPLQRAEEMVPSFPNAQLHTVQRGRLFVHEEFPEEVSQAILSTLAGKRHSASAESDAASDPTNTATGFAHQARM